MPTYILVGFAALIVIAVGLTLRWFHNRSAASKREQHIKVLQGTFGVKSKSGADADASKAPAKAGADTGAKKPGMSLMVHPDADGLRVNGAWLNEVIYYTGDPNPFHGTRNSVRNAQSRARSLQEKCRAARKEQNWESAEELIESAFQELNSGMRQDHWYAADLFHEIGKVRYEQGRYVEAREFWEKAEMVCQEWPTMCHNITPTVESNLKLVRGMLGF